MTDIPDFSKMTSKPNGLKLINPREVQPTLLRNANLGSKNIIDSAWIMPILLILAAIVIFAGYFFSQIKLSPQSKIAKNIYPIVTNKTVLPTSTIQPAQPLQTVQPQAPVQSVSSVQSFNQAQIPNATLSQQAPVLANSALSHIQISAAENNAENQAKQLYAQAVSLIKVGQIDQAVTLLNKSLNIDQGLQKAREALSVLYIQMNDLKSAIILLNKGIELSPNYYDFIKLKGQIYVKEGLLNKALDTLTLNMPNIKEHPGYYELLATIYTKNQQYLIASDIYKQLTTLNPDNGTWWFGLGASLNLSGKDNQARLAYQKALQSDNLKPDVRMYIETQLNA